jgi:hypothetical protein
VSEFDIPASPAREKYGRRSSGNSTCATQTIITVLLKSVKATIDLKGLAFADGTLVTPEDSSPIRLQPECGKVKLAGIGMQFVHAPPARSHRKGQCA